MWYYRQRTMPASRFTPDYVTSRYRTVPMVGKAGGGFIFDTNALHRGMWEDSQNHTRTTLILEFHRHEKVPGLLALHHDMECPSASLAHGNETLTGREGYSLYPTENGAAHGTRHGQE